MAYLSVGCMINSVSNGSGQSDECHKARTIRGGRKDHVQLQQV